jgi:hypothetical protein
MALATDHHTYPAGTPRVVIDVSIGDKWSTGEDVIWPIGWSPPAQGDIVYVPIGEDGGRAPVQVAYVRWYPHGDGSADNEPFSGPHVRVVLNTGPVA